MGERIIKEETAMKVAQKHLQSLVGGFLVSLLAVMIPGASVRAQMRSSAEIEAERIYEDFYQACLAFGRETLDVARWLAREPEIAADPASANLIASAESSVAELPARWKAYRKSKTVQSRLEFVNLCFRAVAIPLETSIEITGLLIRAGVERLRSQYEAERTNWERTLRQACDGAYSAVMPSDADPLDFAGAYARDARYAEFLRETGERACREENERRHRFQHEYELLFRGRFLPLIASLRDRQKTARELHKRYLHFFQAVQSELDRISSGAPSKLEDLAELEATLAEIGALESYEQWDVKTLDRDIQGLWDSFDNWLEFPKFDLDALSTSPLYHPGPECHLQGITLQPPRLDDPCERYRQTLEEAVRKYLMVKGQDEHAVTDWHLDTVAKAETLRYRARLIAENVALLEETTAFYERQLELTERQAREMIEWREKHVRALEARIADLEDEMRKEPNVEIKESYKNLAQQEKARLEEARQALDAEKKSQAQQVEKARSALEKSRESLAQARQTLEQARQEESKVASLAQEARAVTEKLRELKHECDKQEDCRRRADRIRERLMELETDVERAERDAKSLNQDLGKASTRLKQAAASLKAMSAVARGVEDAELKAKIAEVAVEGVKTGVELVVAGVSSALLEGMAITLIGSTAVEKLAESFLSDPVLAKHAEDFDRLFHEARLYLLQAGYAIQGLRWFDGGGVDRLLDDVGSLEADCAERVPGLGDLRRQAEALRGRAVRLKEFVSKTLENFKQAEAKAKEIGSRPLDAQSLMREMEGHVTGYAYVLEEQANLLAKLSEASIFR
jgi:hypothetical protein